MSSDAVTRIKSKTPVPYELTAIHHDTHDTKTFSFALPGNATLDMLPGDHLYVHATINSKPVKRPYTPSSMPGATGHFDLTVKRYETGMISRYLHERQVGESVLMSGPNPGGRPMERRRPSAELTVVARTFTRISSACGCGIGR